MSWKAEKILFYKDTREVRHYAMKRMVNPERDYGAPTMSNKERDAIQKRIEEKAKMRQAREMKTKRK